MKIYELTELQFKNYAQVHSKKNFYQTVEYAKIYEKLDYQKLFLGLIDKHNNVLAAALILSKKIKGKYLHGYAPRGYLIDFMDEHLLTTFTNELKIYLKKKNFISLKIDPPIVYKVKDKNNRIIASENRYMKVLTKLGYTHLGFNNGFENRRSRYNVILNTNNNIDETYQRFSNNIKRNINKSLKMGISIHKGSPENIELFYSVVRKKVKQNFEYFHNYIKYFNNENNKLELYFSKINPQIYIDNYRFLLEKELKLNKTLNAKMQDATTKKTKNLLNKKMHSDLLVEKYSKEIVRATSIYKNYPKGLVVETCAILKNNKEIYFWVDGFEEKLKFNNTSYLLKWEVIKKYMKEGYNTFNLGEVTGNTKKENNPYFGIYQSKIGFNGELYEFPGEFNLIINKPLYAIFKKNINQKKS